MDRAHGQGVAFPLTYIDKELPEELRRTLETIKDVESLVEFVDDYDPPYVCHDAKSRRIRLIVWNLQLLICQVVPDNFDPHDIVVNEYSVGRPDAPARRLLTEEFHESSLRALWIDELGEPVLAEPDRWAVPVSAPPTQRVRVAATTAKEFHQQWMRLKLGQFP